MATLPPMTPQTPAQAASAADAVPTTAIISAMLRSAKNVSDLIFSPGRPPQVEVNSQLIAVRIPQIPMLKPEDTARIAADLLGNNITAARKLREEGSCDVSYSLPPLSRFRVNIFTQRGTCAIVMRVIPSIVPNFETFALPSQLMELCNLKAGIVLVTGPTGSGKSSTLAAVIDKINAEKAYHIVTIEDPIEFLYQHKKGTIHQRELHSDTPSFALALRAALRQAPKVILVGEMRDKETTEIALEAAETGHLVFSTLHTTDASKTIERIVGLFPLDEQHVVRLRFSKAFRYIVAQRLLPTKDGSGRVAAIEILKSTMRTREYVEKGESDGKSLVDAIRDGDQEGMQEFDQVLERYVREGVIDLDTGLAYASNAGNLRLTLSDWLEEQEKEGKKAQKAVQAGVVSPAAAARPTAPVAARPVAPVTASVAPRPAAPAAAAKPPAPVAVAPAKPVAPGAAPVAAPKPNGAPEIERFGR